MADEQQNPTAEPEQGSVGADASVTNAAAADVEAALSDQTLDDQAEDTGTAGDEDGAADDTEAEAVDVSDDATGDDDAAAADEPADDDTSAEADDDTGPDVEQDEEGVAEVKEHATNLLGSDEEEGAVPSEYRVPPGIPSGLDPGKPQDRDIPPKPTS
jgi:hypothetical protein